MACFAGVVVAHLGTMTACYEPQLADCTVQCADPSDCAGGQTCRDDGWCASPEAAPCPTGGGGGGGGGGQATVDASTSTTADASQSLCQQGCTNGTCVGGVCVIDCGATMSCRDHDIKCPANLPCRVVCGERSCAKKILCEKATSCEVRCTGNFACADEILCNENRCDVECTGANACKKTKCGASCACDVTCTGIGSCTDPNECSAVSCRLGEGCSSQLAGCNAC